MREFYTVAAAIYSVGIFMCACFILCVCVIFLRIVPEDRLVLALR